MADEGMNYFFDITGDADEKLKALDLLIKGLVSSVLNLDATAKETEGGSKAIRKGAKETVKVLTKEERALKRQKEQLKKIKVARKAATTATKNFNTAAERAGLSLKEETSVLRKATALIRKRAIEERKLILLQRKGFDSTGRRIGQYKVEAQAIDEVNRRLYKKALAERVAQLATKKGIATAKERALVEGRTAAATARTAAATDRAARSTRRYSTEVSRASRQGNRAAFIFRRLFGVLAAFTAARFAIEGFFLGVKEAILFNKNIQQAQLGIASLFTAVGQVRNEMGEVVTGAEGLAVAMKEAKRQTALLRKDALSTAATFDELLQTFQIGLAPGLAAGLSPDDVRNLAIRISQAAAAIGLPMNQLSEEIRSILAGTIQQRTTRIAAALGITNEDIRNAKQAGQLFSFLSDRFDAFGVAGQQAMNQFFGIVTRVQDALKQLLGAAGLGFFEQLQTLLRETFELVTETKDLVPRPDPQAVRVLSTIFTGFENATKNVRDLVKTLSGADLAATAAAVGAIIEIGTAVVLGFLQGIVEVFGTLRQIADPLLSVFQGVSDSIPGEELREVVASITQIIGLMFVWKQLTLAIGAIQKANLFTMKGLVGILAVAFLATNKLLAKFLDVKDVSFESTFELITTEFINTFEIIIARMRVLVGAGLDLMVYLAANAANAVKIAWLQFIRVIGTAMSFFSDEQEKQLQKVYKALDKAENNFADLKDENTAKELKNLTIVEAEAERRSRKILQQIRNEAEAAESKQKADLEEIKNAAKFNGLIGIGVHNLKAQAAIVKQVTKNMEEASQQAAFKAAFGFDVSSDTSSAIQAINSAFASVRTSTEQVNGQITQMTDGLMGVRAQLKGAVDKSEEQKELLAREKSFVEALAVLRQESLLLEDKILATALTKITLARKEWLVKQSIARTVAQEELLGQKAILEAQRQRLSSAEIELLKVDLRIEAIRAEKQAIVDRYAAEISAQQQLLQFGNMTSKQRVIAEKVITELYAQQRIELEELNILMESLGLRAESLGDEVEGGIIGGMERGFQQFGNQFESSFQAGVTIARQATEQLASFISNLISDAFDPNSDKSWKQRLGEFLQQMANMIMQTLIKLAIAKAIMGIFGAAPAAGPVSASAGGFQGGLIKAFAPLMSHFGATAQGLAKGGSPRPKGLHPSDKIPIWAALGEFMQPVKAVRMYGLKAMNALKEGLINPAALNALVNTGHVSGESRKRSSGYADGGVVTQVVSNTETEKSHDQADAAKTNMPIAALPATDTTMDSLLAGGDGAMQRWLQRKGFRPHGA